MEAHYPEIVVKGKDFFDLQSPDCSKTDAINERKIPVGVLKENPAGFLKDFRAYPLHGKKVVGFSFLQNVFKLNKLFEVWGMVSKISVSFAYYKVGCNKGCKR